MQEGVPIERSKREDLGASPFGEAENYRERVSRTSEWSVFPVATGERSLNAKAFIGQVAP